MERLLSVGIDLGTTTTQMVVSELEIVNQAPAFSVPQMVIDHRNILYRSAIYVTPLLDSETLDAEAIRNIIAEEYRMASITPDMVQTGAVMITGETARKENARAVLQTLSNLAGEFVVAAAGPALESVLAARGAGADRLAKERGKPVLHLDIGGGTSNLALFDSQGELLETGCLNVGGRLIKLDRQGRVEYRSPVLRGLPGPEVGQQASPEALKPLLHCLVEALEQACGLCPRTELLEHLITDRSIAQIPEHTIFSFSGGVAALMGQSGENWRKYDDLGVLLAEEICRSKLCAGEYALGQETIRATVIGAGTYSTQLSGSTVYYHRATFPIQNIPVITAKYGPGPWAKDALRQVRSLYPGETIALAVEHFTGVHYEDMLNLADQICTAWGKNNDPVIVILAEDLAKSLGHALRSRLGPERTIVCLDGLYVPRESYLDIGNPVGHGAALPVIIKTLAF